MALDDYAPLYDAAGQEWNVDPALVRAVAGQESNGNPNAVSKAGAQGLTGLMPGTQKALGVTNALDPAQAIFGAAKYLSQGLDAEGSPEGALLYYHGGPNWRQSYGPESAGYVPAVTARYQQAQAAPQSPPGAGSPAAKPSAPSSPASATPSDADFLQATTGGGSPGTSAAPAKSGPSDSDFLSMTGAKPAPAAPATPAQADPGGVGRNVAAGVLEGAGNAANTALDPSGNLIGKPLATAAVFAHDALAPLFGYQRFPDDVRNLLLGDTVAQPGSAAVNAVGRAVGADPSAVAANTPGEKLARAGGAGATMGAVAGPVGALLGASGGVTGEVAGQLAPAWAAPAASLAGNILGGGLLSEAITPRLGPTRAASNLLNRFSEGADPAPIATPPPNYLSPEFTAAPIAPQAAQAVEAARATPATPQPSETGPMPTAAGPATGPVPQAAGAAPTGSAAAEMTPAEVQAYRSTAEGSKLLEPQPIGTPDRNLYVPGSNPNTAEIEQSVNTARDLKTLNVTAPAVSQEAKEIAGINNDARQRFFQGIAGSKVDIANAEAARTAQLEQDYPAAFAGAKDANTEPVVEAIQDALNTPRNRQNTQLGNYIKPLLGRLVDEDGNLKITNPEELYGFREDLNRMRSKASQASDPNLSHVSGELGDIIGATDQAIEKAAPGYRQYMDNYAAASRKIEAMQVLQGHENGLYNGSGGQMRMGFANVQRMMRNAVDSRAAPGLNPYKSLTEDQMTQLWALRDDLRRSASAQELARTPGSDTAQNAWDIARHVGMEGAAHIAANVVSPGLGSLAVAGIKNVLSPAMAMRRQRQATARGLAILRGDPGSLRNPLQPDQ